MKRHIIKMAAAVLGSVLLAGYGDLPAYANSGEDPNPDEITTKGGKQFLTMTSRSGS